MTRAIALLAGTLTLYSGCAATRNFLVVRAYHALEEANYEAALTRLSSAERQAELPHEIKAEIAFLRARSYEGLRDVPEAIGLYRYLIATYPDSPYSWAAKEKLKRLEYESQKPPAVVRR